MREMNNVHARASQPSNEPLLDKNSPGSDSNKSNARDISQPTKLHLVAPALMIIFFLAGVTISLGHHFYYQWLDGQIVRSTDRQQWALR
jgi:hypothetical protein